MNALSILPDDNPPSMPSMNTVRGRTTPRGERLHAGDVLLGRYTVLSELGEGGMGVVYKCLDSVGGIEVALKCLPPELSRNEGEMEGIRENYALVAKLHHSAISGLRNLEKDPDFGEYYLVMDLAEGEDLSAILRRRHGAPMPLPEALAILRPLASALDYAHGEKVLHRDVKPGNVKVLPAAEPGGAPRVQLLDFGLAAEVRSSLSRVSRKGYLGSSGTPAYMAPEQWEARPQGPATDQYALAVLAYQMLAGSRPFDADDPDLLRRAVLSREPDPIPNLPHGANAALLRALAKDPAARFPSCKAFVEALAKGRDASMTRRLRHAGWLAAAFVAVSVVGALRLAPSEDRLEIRFRETVRKGWIGPLFSKRPALETVVPLHWKEIAREADPDEQVWILLKDERKGADNWCIATKGRVADGIRIRGTMRELLDRLSTAGSPKSLPGQSSSSSPRPPTRSHSSSPPTSAGLPTSPPEGADGKSHAEGAGGAPEGRAAPDMPALPSEGALLEDLQAARSRFQHALDARRAEEWPDDSEASASLLAGIASLDGRIVSALEAKEAADREAEAAQLARLEEESLNAARASAKAAKDEEAIRVLQAGAARDAAKAEPFRKWAGEGEFKARFETLDGRKAVLDGCSKAADLSEAQTAAANVRVAADWIADNAAVRGELDELERALDAFAPDLEKAEAARYAPAALYKAKTAREAAAVLRNRSQFGEAKEKLKSARKQYEEALASARTARAAVKAKESLVEAEAAKIREDWSAVLAAAEKALEWEPDNSDAKALQAEAEKNLRPTLSVTATLAVDNPRLVSRAWPALVVTNAYDGEVEVVLEIDGRETLQTLAPAAVHRFEFKNLLAAASEETVEKNYYFYAKATDAQKPMQGLLSVRRGAADKTVAIRLERRPPEPPPPESVPLVVAPSLAPSEPTTPWPDREDVLHATTSLQAEPYRKAYNGLRGEKTDRAAAILARMQAFWPDSFVNVEGRMDVIRKMVSHMATCRKDQCPDCGTARRIFPGEDPKRIAFWLISARKWVPEKQAQLCREYIEEDPDFFGWPWDGDDDVGYDVSGWITILWKTQPETGGKDVHPADREEVLEFWNGLNGAGRLFARAYRHAELCPGCPGCRKWLDRRRLFAGKDVEDRKGTILRELALSPSVDDEVWGDTPRPDPATLDAMLKIVKTWNRAASSAR